MATATKKAAPKAAAKTITKKAPVKIAAKATTTAAPKAAATKAPAKTTTKSDASFEYFSPESSSVYIAGSFSNWEMKKMKKDKTGNWKYKAKVPKGEHQYKYVFEGVSWEIDNSAPTVNTELGLNNIIKV
ncbi:MAG: glycogen-binding domain-containing protein [Fibrobacterales bacterium]